MTSVINWINNQNKTKRFSSQKASLFILLMPPNPRSNHFLISAITDSFQEETWKSFRLNNTVHIFVCLLVNKMFFKLSLLCVVSFFLLLINRSLYGYTIFSLNRSREGFPIFNFYE
jgi:hypothetical protein